MLARLKALGCPLIVLLAGACSSTVTTGGSSSSIAGSGNGGSSGGIGDGGAGNAGGSVGPTAGAGGGVECELSCGSSCCDSTAVCVDDGAGNLSCALQCASDSDCPTSEPRCLVRDGGVGACVADTGGQPCSTGADCVTGACAPNVDTHGNPVGPMVCVPNDGAPYHGCNGMTICETGTCCFADTSGNLFCATQCTDDTQCGDAHCQLYDNSHTLCTGELGCGPF